MSCRNWYRQTTSDNNCSSCDEITVSDIIINGTKYMIDYNTCKVYSCDNEECVGKYNCDTKQLVTMAIE